MLQPQSIESIVPNRHDTRSVAVGFYSRLVDEGFTREQIFDLSLRLLDHVASEKRADPSVAELLSAK
ncbi:MAG: hypothetical protein H6737_26675 [Alphaproteobacteria bacterium]|nr:hypothetical protein [Alphaproteobacteria bacterium]